MVGQRRGRGIPCAGPRYPQKWGDPGPACVKLREELKWEAHLCLEPGRLWTLVLALPRWGLLLLTGALHHPWGIVISLAQSLDWKGTEERAQTRPGHSVSMPICPSGSWHEHLKLFVFSITWAPPH